MDTTTAYVIKAVNNKVSFMVTVEKKLILAIILRASTIMYSNYPNQLATMYLVW